MKTVSINEKSSKGKMLMEILKKFEDEGIVKFEKQPNSETRKAMSAAKKNQVTNCSSVEDMINKLNK